MFESVTCSRCGGTGQFSYCLRYGTKCFKCGGHKKVLTKRGAAASQYLRELRSKPAGELKVGDKIRALNVTLGGEPYESWETIESMTPTSYYAGRGASGMWYSNYEEPFNGNDEIKWEKIEAVEIKTNKGKLGAIPVTRKYRVAFTGEEAEKTAALALEYQNSLTKAGTPRKIKAKVA